MTETAPEFDEKKWLEEELESFMKARETNSVVNQLFVPDSSLESFKKFHLEWDDRAFHRAVSFIAHKRGELGALCHPLKEIIFEHRGGPAALTKQYRRDLEESWYKADQYNQRQARCNKFLGKLIEFHVATFVEKQYGWHVKDMEAFQEAVPSPDILCATSSNKGLAISCKSLCQSPEVFDLTIQAGANNGVSCGWLSVYSPIDYLLYRICEGAWSLSQFKDQYRVVIVPLLHAANFKLQLDNNWIDFSDPQFLNQDNQMQQFWKSKESERQKAQFTLGEMSQHLDGIVICEIGNGYRLSVCKEHWYRPVN